MAKGYRIASLVLDHELRAFKEGYETNLAERSNGALRLSVQLEYLASSRVAGVLDASSQLVGGYVIRCEPPFRCLRAVPDDLRRNSRFLHETPEESLCELTCIWRSRRLPSARFATTVWPRIIFDSVRAGRRYILGIGFDNRMHDVYQVCSPENIYAGPSAASETATMVHVFAFSRFRIVANFLTNFVLQVPGKGLRAFQGRK